MGSRSCSSAVSGDAVALSRVRCWWEPWSELQLLALLRLCLAPAFSLPWRCLVPLCDEEQGPRALGWHHQLGAFTGMGLHCAGAPLWMRICLDPVNISSPSALMHSTRVPEEHWGGVGSSLCHAWVAAAAPVPSQVWVCVFSWLFPTIDFAMSPTLSSLWSFFSTSSAQLTAGEPSCLVSCFETW